MEKHIGIMICYRASEVSPHLCVPSRFWCIYKIDILCLEKICGVRMQGDCQNEHALTCTTGKKYFGMELQY